MGLGKKKLGNRREEEGGESCSRVVESRHEGQGIASFEVQIEHHARSNRAATGYFR